jgi:hypothetical protein
MRISLGQEVCTRPDMLSGRVQGRASVRDGWRLDRKLVGQAHERGQV